MWIFRCLWLLSQPPVEKVTASSGSHRPLTMHLSRATSSSNHSLCILPLSRSNNLEAVLYGNPTRQPGRVGFVLADASGYHSPLTMHLSRATSSSNHSLCILPLSRSNNIEAVLYGNPTRQRGRGGFVLADASSYHCPLMMHLSRAMPSVGNPAVPANRHNIKPAGIPLPEGPEGRVAKNIGTETTESSTFTSSALGRDFLADSLMLLELAESPSNHHWGGRESFLQQACVALLNSAQHKTNWQWFEWSLPTSTDP